MLEECRVLRVEGLVPEGDVGEGAAEDAAHARHVLGEGEGLAGRD